MQGTIGTPNWARLTWRTGFDVYRGQPYLAEEEKLVIQDVGIHILDLAKSAKYLQQALDALDQAEPSAQSLAGSALDQLERVLDHDPRLLPAVQALRDVQAQLQDASHTLSAYLHKADLDPARLAELDDRVSAWMTLARRYRRHGDALEDADQRLHELGTEARLDEEHLRLLSLLDVDGLPAYQRQ